jgi:hypothetical protein
MKTQSNGSIVLLAVILMGIASLLLFTALQEGAFLRMFIGKQIVAEQNASLGYGLLFYGINQAKKNYGYLMQQEPVVLELLLEGAIGRLTLARNPEGVAIAGELLRGSGVVFRLACLVSQNSDKKFIIQGFQR